MNKYKESLEWIDEEGLYYFGDGGEMWSVPWKDTIKQALKIAHRLETGEVDLNTLFIGLDKFPEDSTMEMERPEFYMKNAFKAMSKQLIKEVEDE